MQDWQRSVIYQIYPKSFYSHAGNPTGDLLGVVDKLDYLQWLGVDYLWLTPFLRSPQRDNGYDISDYYAIDPSYGSMADCELLIREAGARGLKLTARSLVLVDDEASTGTTFINVCNALADAGLESIERIVSATLTDWSQGALRKAKGRHASSVSLLAGRYTFAEDTHAELPEMPSVGTVGQGHWPLEPERDWGRMGAC